jgi:hypothetical protein
VLDWKPISNRPKGRPKIRWEDDVKKDIQMLKMPNWKTLVQERGRWKEVVSKAKTALRVVEPYLEEVCCIRNLCDWESDLINYLQHGTSFDYAEYTESLIHLTHTVGHMVAGNFAITILLFCCESRSTHFISMPCSLYRASDHCM